MRLPSGNLAVFSPPPHTPEVQETVQTLGTVKYLICPDLEHHIWLDVWNKEYPEAKVIGPDGLGQKRDKSDVAKIKFDVVFRSNDAESRKVDEEFDKEFNTAYVPEHANKELVFNFVRERTLIQADLFFNLPAIEQYSKSPENPHSGITTKAINAAGGTTGSALLWQQRLLWHMISIGNGNRGGFNKSVAAIDKWDFDRIIPCHGDVIETGGKGIFRRLFAWHLTAAEQ